MPNRPRNRGPHPKDDRCFAPAQLNKLTTAVEQMSWLLERGYPPGASLKIVGDRHALRDRQRQALQRCAAADSARDRRGAHRIDWTAMRGEALLIDGYNVLLTVESALSGGIVLGARDGTFRDLSALSRHYRHVETTQPALDKIGELLHASGCGPTTWLLDRPISNSGRLAERIRAVADAGGYDWRAELVADPDPLLRDSRLVVATADSAILDRCDRWLNLAREAVERCAPDAWIVDLSDGSDS